MTAGAKLTDTILHASCVALDGRGLLILGPSGSGKSTLAIRMMALGADLISDDRTLIRHTGAELVASAPAAIRGLIEARGVGLFRAPHLAQATIVLAADLGETETDRLPPRRTRTILGVPVDLVHAAQNPHVAATLMLYLRHGRHA